MKALLHFKWDLLITAAALVFIGLLTGRADVVFASVILMVMEISFSFDNAIVNVRILKRMSPFWVFMFLTAGMLIAVLGMRFVFPIGIVSITTGAGFGEVTDLALNQPDVYQQHLREADLLIAMFGGIYLILLFLNFVFTKREVLWLGPIEARLAKAGRLDNLAIIIASIVVVVLSFVVNPDEGFPLFVAGALSIFLYVAVDSFSKMFDTDDEGEASSGGTAVRTGFGAFSLFIYLEVQDSAFSFDGVSAAFAITNNVYAIAISLGVGALWVRTFTVDLLKSGKLAEFRFLEHGAHWAIGALAVCMLLKMTHVEVPEYITGLIGVVFILIAGYHSTVVQKREDAELASMASDEADLSATQLRDIV